MGEGMNITSTDDREIDELRTALFGRSVIAVKMTEISDKEIAYGQKVQGEVHLDDGTVLNLAGNEGGCSCSAGDYYLTRLNDMPVNGITNVQVKVSDGSEDEWGFSNTAYSIFVAAFDGAEHELATFEGDDGNGYYGTGFWFDVQAPA